MINDSVKKSAAFLLCALMLCAAVLIAAEPAHALDDEPIPPEEVEEPEEPEEPVLSKTSLSMKAGQEYKISVSHGVVKSWTSSNTKVVTVKSGLLTALKKGKATITATLTTGRKLSCILTVTTSPKLSKSSVTVSRGKTVKVRIRGKAASVRNTYKNTSIAKVASKRSATALKIKGLKKGSTTLRIKVNGMWLKLGVKVK